MFATVLSLPRPGVAQAAPSFELDVQGGVAMPAFWSKGYDRQGLGPSAHLGGYYVLSEALALGVGAEWAHLSWRTEAETDESVDTLLAAPELRWRIDPAGSSSFTATAGVGLAFVWPSAVSSSNLVRGGPAARVAVGWEYAVTPLIRLGADVGGSYVLNMSADTCGCGQEVNPGAPQGAGNVLSARVGARWGF